MAVAAALWAPRLTGPIDLRYDAGVYYTLGTALAEGRGYRLLNEPGAIAALQYPPLLPIIVAGHQWITGTADPAVTGRALRFTFAALFVAYTLAVFAFARRWLATGWAVVAALLVLLNLQLLWLSDTLFAELPFALAALLFLLVADREDRRGLAAALGAASYLLRSSGLALLAAWVLDALRDRRLVEAALRAVLAALPILGWQAYVARVQHSPEYAEPAYAYQRAAYQFYNVAYADNLAYVDAFAPERGVARGGALVERAIANALRIPEHLGESISVRAEGPLHPVFRLNPPPAPASPLLAMSRAGFTAVGFVAASGLLVLIALGGTLPVLFWAVSLGLMALTPWPSQFARYLMPLAPITAVGLVLMLANAARLPGRVMQTLISAAIGIVLAAEIVVLSVAFTARHTPVAGSDQRLFFYGPAWQRHDAALAWIASAAAPDEITATTTPHRLYLASGLRAVLPPFEPDPASAERLLDSVPVTYLVIDDLDHLDVSRRYGAPVVAADPEGWRLVYDTPGGPLVYKRAR